MTMNGALLLRDFGFADLSVQRQTAVLLAANEVTAEYGLVLSEADVRQILQTRAESLRESARVEFGEGIAAKLVLAFADSP